MTPARALAALGLSLWSGGGVGTLLATRAAFRRAGGTPLARPDRRRCAAWIIEIDLGLHHFVIDCRRSGPGFAAPTAERFGALHGVSMLLLLGQLVAAAVALIALQ